MIELSALSRITLKSEHEPIWSIFRLVEASNFDEMLAPFSISTHQVVIKNLLIIKERFLYVRAGSL